jgi:SAM-dependent methyltransferase
LTSRLTATQEFFDSYWCNKKVRILDSTGRFAISATRRAYSAMGDIRGKSILEIGTGEGYDLRRLDDSGADVLGIDISSEGLRLTREQCPRVGLMKMDGARLGFGDSVFDIVFSRTLLMHLDRRLFLEECRRVLKPGGKAIFVEPLKSNPFLLPYRAAFSSGRFISPDYLKPVEADHMRRVFRSVSIWHFYLLSAIGAPLASVAPWSTRLFFPLELFDRALLSIIPFLKNLCWITVIECRK